MLTKKENAKLFHKLLLENTEQQIGDNDEDIGLLFSGGIDSLGVLFCLQELNKNVRAYTFYLENNISKDILSSRKLCEMLDIPLVEVEIPRKTIKDDIIHLAKHYDCKTKVSFETNIHLLHTFPKVKEKFLANGIEGMPWGYGGYEYIYKNDFEGFKEYRLKHYQTFYTKHDGKYFNLFEKNFGVKSIMPYVGDKISDFLLQFSLPYLNTPRRKWIILEAFADRFKETGVRPTSSYQIQSGMAKYCELFLEDKDFNFNNRTRMLDVYRDLYEKYGKTKD